MSRSYSSILGHAPNFWLWSNRDGFDMTHPATPDSPPVYPRMSLHTTDSRLIIAPRKTALVIIDMANYFLSAALGRKRGEGHAAQDVLLEIGLPAARQAGIQIIWINWGISEDSLKTLPPIIWRSFGWEINDTGSFELEDDLPPTAIGHDGAAHAQPQLLTRKEKRCEGGVASLQGKVELEDGTTVDAGRVLMIDQWNTQLHGPLQHEYESSLTSDLPDVTFTKERSSALWGPAGPFEDFLHERGINTLLFAGVNLDQCVLATMQDAATKAFDTVLL